MSSTNPETSSQAGSPRQPLSAPLRGKGGGRARAALPRGACALPKRRPRTVVYGSARETLERILSTNGTGGRYPSRPALTMLVLGGEGTDRTGLARGLARGLFGTETALLDVDCAEYQEARRASEFLGVGEALERPQGKENLMTQRRLDGPHLRAMIGRRGRVGANAGLSLSLVNPALVRPLSVVLFHDIEKAHPILRDALLEILQTGRLVLGDGSVTSFAHTIVVMTSGVGSREIHDAARSLAEGGSPRPAEERKAEISRVARAAASASFPADFLDAVDEVHVAGPTSRAALERLFDRLLLDAHARVRREGLALSIRVSPEARRFLVERGRPLLFGPRRVCRAMDAELIEPLLRLVRAGSLRAGDAVDVVKHGARLVFFRSPRRGMLAV